MLISKEEARKQHFLALYNLPLDNQNKIARLVTESQHRVQELPILSNEHILKMSFVVCIIHGLHGLTIISK